MKKTPLIIYFIIFALNSYSQIIFEKGYFIDNQNQKTECLIKNVDWMNNPIEFEYKITETSETKKETIENVKEFSIYNISKYIRAYVKIDISSENINEMTSERNPIFKEEKIFLKVLIEGKASLYEYSNKNLRRYFYSKDNLPIEQLIFKSYKNKNDQIVKNNYFRQQLWNSLKCNTIDIKKAEKLSFKKNSLIIFFEDYNKCNNIEITNYSKKQKRSLFNINISFGLNHSSLSIKNTLLSSKNVSFDKKIGYKFGIEFEVVMPFNKNKWNIVLEPTYQYFKSEQEIYTQNVSVDYRSIELPIGIRHYFYLNEKSKIFINGSIVFDFPINSYINYQNSSDLKIKSLHNYELGIGYNYGNRYSFEIRYFTNREILNGSGFYHSNYNSLSILLRYKILNR